MKLWQKDNAPVTSEKIERFTVGRDRELDIHLAPFDVLGSMAHAIMLQSIGLLTADETNALLAECQLIYQSITEKKDFEILPGIEDVHSQVEWQLTQKLGETGKKIHSGRSRNDQVLVDLKMFNRHKIQEVVDQVQLLFTLLQAKSEQHKGDLLPGYTHLQIAMPSSFGLWFGAYAESLVDDLLILQGVYKVVNKNPLGSGAGYGSSFPLNRKLTTQLLGFDTLNYNVVYAQMTRGKTEYLVTTALTSLANTLSRLAMDVCLYNSQNFGFLLLPPEMTTGSSIMPHKKNPDVAELLRAKTNKLKALPMEIAFIMSNLPSGYHRDMQLVKEILMPAFDEILECLEITTFMITHIQVKQDLLASSTYDLLFSVENVNALVGQGVPFRDAYKTVGHAIEAGEFVPNRDLAHTLEGSIGNLETEAIAKQMQEVIAGFQFEKVQQAYENLLNYPRI
ncbi:MAG: argininosuccinate lyase [Spirosomataceae bacterium]